MINFLNSWDSCCSTILEKRSVILIKHLRYFHMFSFFSQKVDLLIKAYAVFKVIWKMSNEFFLKCYKSTQFAFSAIKFSSLVKLFMCIFTGISGYISYQRKKITRREKSELRLEWEEQARECYSESECVSVSGWMLRVSTPAVTF